MLGGYKRLILIAALVACGPKPNESVGTVDGYEMIYAGEVRETDVWCNDECPDLASLGRRMDSVYNMFEPHLRRGIRKGSNNYYKSSKINIRFSKYVWMINERQIYGAFLGDTTVWIYYPYECDCEKGLCGGVLDYELGHVFMRSIRPANNERQNLEYRIENSLLYSEDAMRCRDEQ